MIRQDPTLTIDLAPDERLDSVNESIRLIQKKQGLTYGTDAFLLAAFLRPQPSVKAVELGAGTGIVSLLAATKNKVKSVCAVEIQPCFSDLIARNAELNGLAPRVYPLCADLRDLKPSDVGEAVGLVFANPPYMKCNAGKRNEKDEKYIARHEVMGGIADFCECAGRLLQTGGRFVTVWRPDRLTELLYALHTAKLEPKRMTFVCADAKSEPCMVLTEAVKDAAPALSVTAPLLLYQAADANGGTRRLTPEAQEVYDTCRLSYENTNLKFYT